MRNLIVTVGICLLIYTDSAQVKTRSYIVDPNLVPREHNVDFKQMRLEVSFEPAKGLVKGKVTHVFSPLQQKVDSIYLDAIGFKIKEASLNGKTVKYKSDSSGITFYPNPSLAWETTDSLSITYEATPRKGLYFIGWNDPNNMSRKQIWSQGQGTDNRNWIPMYDEMNDKLLTEVTVKFEKDYKVLSNGQFINVIDNKDGTNTWHYKMNHPHSSYLVMLGIGKYDIKETQSKSGVPMHLYYYPEWKDRTELTYKYSEQMVDFFEKEIGVPYAWESYSQIPVQDYMFGAMENTTATVYGDFFCVDERGFADRSYVAVNAHELAHQWFGDLVTARSDAHHWLQESFATYYNQLFEREVFGQDHFDWLRRGANNAALEASNKDVLAVAHSEGGGTRHYPKGAFVLNMLKYVSGGREAYNKAIKHYLESHKYANVDTEDLLIAFHETLGLSLDWFFEEWIYKGGEPRYDVRFQDVNGTSEFTVMQTHDLTDVSGLPGMGKPSSHDDPFVSSSNPEFRQAGLFKMPIWFEVHYTDGTVDKKQIIVSRQTEIIKIPNSGHKKIDFVLFDPNNEVMKEAHFDKPFEMLQAQAMKAENMLDRYDALVAIGNTSLEKKRDFLIQVYNKETFQATKSEVVKQLAGDKNPKSIDLLKKAIDDKDVIVRKTVLKQVEKPSPEIIAEMEKLLKDPSYEIVEASLQKLSNLNPSKTSEYLEMTKGIEGTVGRNVTVKWLEIAYNSTGDKQYADKLITYSTDSYEFRTRANAMTALKRSDYFNQQLMDALINAIYSSNGRLSGPANETFLYFYNQDKNKKEISDYLASKEWTEWQKKILAPYLK